MNIKCIKNRINQMNNEEVIPSLCEILGKHIDEEIDWFELGQEYIVYAITFHKNIPFFCVLDEVGSLMETCAYFYEVIDGRFSRYWQFGYMSGNQESDTPCIAFKEWAEDMMFHEKVLDDYPKEVEIFSRYKKLMDEEFD